MNKKLYIAYGSNLNTIQMKYRCPNASIYCKGMLNDWKLAYRGFNRGAYATVIESLGYHVPVVIWLITNADEKALDRYEGYPNFYYKMNIDVLTDNGIVNAMAYIMNDLAETGVPSVEYIRTIQNGYISNQLDLKYLIDSLS